MKKTMIVMLFAVLAVVALAGTASAQAVDCDINSPTFYDPNGVCPDDVVRPPDDNGVAPTGTLPRTGSDSLPLAQMAIVLIGVGGALAILANRKRTSSVPA